MKSNAQAKTRDTRKALLQTAMELIWVNNFGSVSVDEICKAAGVQKGSFYHFFESKTELAREALLNLWEEFQPALDHTFSPLVPGLERLRAYAKLALEEQRQELDRRGIVVGCPFSSVGSERMAEDDGVTRTCWDLLQRFKKYFSLALRDAKESGDVKIADHESAADEMFLHYLGCLSAARLSGTVAPMENLFERWCMLLGISAAPNRSKTA